MSLQVWLPLNDGTLRQQGLNPIVPTLLSGTSFTAGKLGQGLYNSGDGQGINLPNYMAQLKTYTTYSMMAWVYLDAQATNHSSTIISSGNWNTATGQCCFGLYSYSSGYGVILCPNRSGWSNGVSYSSKVTLNKWYHIAITYNGTKTIAYVNGEKVGEYNSGGICQNSETNNVYIGSATYYSGFTLKGKINDVRIYNNCLSPQEIKEISKGLVLHYPLNHQGMGQENLLQNTNFDSNFVSSLTVNSNINLNQWHKESSSVSLSMDGQYVKLHYEASTSRYGIHYEIALEPGTYTYSITAGGRMTCSFGPATNWPSDNRITTNTPGRYSVTFTVTEAATWRMYIYTTSYNPDIWFNWPKLEVGDKATSWCPSYDDTLSQSKMGPLFVGRKDVYDCSGFNHNGYSRGFELTNLKNIYQTDTPNKYSVSTHFYSTSQKIQISDFPTSGFANSYSFAWWAKAPSLSSGAMMWGFSDGIRLNGFHGGTLWNTGDSSDNPLYIPGTTTKVTAPTGNTWHHFVMVGDGSTCKAYKDGELWGQAKTYKSISGTSIYINGWDNGTNYTFSDMYMSDFRIYATALSANDIKSLYQNEAAFDDQGNILGPIR